MKTSRFRFLTAELDFVLITHAHIDHSGNLPMIYAHGFRGDVYMTEATVDLCNIMLRDSAHIQMSEAEWKNKRNRRAGREEYVPPYTMEDALGVIQHLIGFPYEKRVELAEGIRVRFVDAGHLLGSASIELWLTDGWDHEEAGVFRRYRKSGSAADQQSPLYQRSGLCHYGIYLWRPQPWRAAGLCFGAGSGDSGDL